MQINKTVVQVQLTMSDEKLAPPENKPNCL
jgi:hypothetical protein